MQCQGAHDLHARPDCCSPGGCAGLIPMVLILPGEEVWVPGFNIASLLPVNLKYYYRYNGSLTTPPCYQAVRWTVFNQTMMISRDQVCQGDEPMHHPCIPSQSPGSQRQNDFLMLLSFQMLKLITSLRNDDGKPLQSNYRQIQSLHGRPVLASFQPAFFAPKQLPAGKECLEYAQGAGMQREGKEQELRHPISLTSICPLTLRSCCNPISVLLAPCPEEDLGNILSLVLQK